MQTVSNDKALEIARDLLVAKIQVSESKAATVSRIKSSLKELYDFIKTLD